MDKNEALRIANLYAQAINEKYSYSRIILFGSYAKGNYHDESDIDIAIVFDDYNNLIDMQVDLMRIRRKIDSRIEPHPFRKSEFEVSNPIVSEILKYGEELIHNVA